MMIEKKRAGKWLQNKRGDRYLSGQKEMIIEKKRAGKWLQSKRGDRDLS